ncbi:MAG: hypothetical protein AAF679_03425 [Pseudomonadota bacterium]
MTWAQSISPDSFWMISILVCLALVCVSHAYLKGGEFTKQQYAIPVPLGERTYKVSGCFGDAAVVLSLSVGIFITNVLIPKPTVTEHVWFWCVAAGLYTAMLIWVWRYSAAQMKALKVEGDPGFNDLIENSYKLYRFYGAMVPTICGLLIFKLFVYGVFVFQAFTRDLAQFEIALETLANDIGDRPLGNEEAMRILEQHTQFQFISLDILAQLEPIAFLAILAMLTNVLVDNTPIKRAFQAQSKAINQWLTVFFVGLLLTASVLAFFVEFSALNTVFVAFVQDVSANGFTTLQAQDRVLSAWTSVARQSGLSGFLRLFVSEGGLILVLFAAVQLALPKILSSAPGPRRPET